MKYFKYHGLGNDYIVIEPPECGGDLSVRQIRLICSRNLGLGSDGILLGPFKDDRADAGVRIFNPDGSEAEKSGNGLRIFARHLWDRGFAEDRKTSISVSGGLVRCSLDEKKGLIGVDMGRVTFHSSLIPASGPPRDVLEEKIRLGEKELEISAAGLGNPHCIIIKDEVSEEEARLLGPELEVHPLFPSRTNVQFVKLLDRSSIRIEIWERGAGYTLASGSSSVAAAAVARRLGFCGDHVSVHMPGGTLSVQINGDYRASLEGPVTRVSEGLLHPELFEQKLPD